MYTDPGIQSTINQFNGNAFNGLRGFELYSSPDTVYYYVMDWGASKVFILNDQWSFISSKVFTYLHNMISIGNSLYMIGSDNVWKLDQDLNILINYNPDVYPFSPEYTGISYNPSNGLIYVASANLREILSFNLDLTLIRSFSTLEYNPYSITFSSNQLYVGTTRGIIFVYKNEILINQFDGCNGNTVIVSSILFDPNGHMATSCSYPTNTLYLFTPDGSFTDKSIKTPSIPDYIGFDSKGRFILILDGQISIY